MKQLKLFALVILALVVFACGEVPTPSSPGGDSTPPASSTQSPAKAWPADAQPLVDLALADLLARTKVGTATVISVEAVDWPDGCLGCAKKGELCTQAIVPGYRIVLQSGGQQYEYRTDTKSTIRLCPAGAAWGPEAQPLVDLALADLLARTKVATATVVSVEAVEWRNGCLECAEEGELCTEAIVPGYRIVLQSGSQQYEYRTDAKSTIRLCPASSAWGPEAQPLVDLALADLLARTKVATATVVSVEAVEWRNGCLECAEEAELCTEAIVPGYRIVLQSGAEQYEYRTDTRSTIRPCPADPAWSKEVQQLVDKALADLAERLQIGRDQIKVVSVEQMMWRDSSIGCPKPGQAYLTVIVPGFKIVLEAERTTYNYHAGDKGEVFWCEKPAQ